MARLYKNLILPLMAAAIGTISASAADRSISIEVSQEADTYGNYAVTLTPSDQETPYVWFFIDVNDFEAKGGYDGIVDTKIKEYEQYASWYEDVWTFFRDQESSTGTVTSDMYSKWGTDYDGGKYYVVAFGVDDNKEMTFPLTIAHYPNSDEPLPGPQPSDKAFKFEITDLTTSDFNITITPGENVGNYYFYMGTSEDIEDRGGVETIDETYDIPWWEYVASIYNDPDAPWTYFMKNELKSGVTSGSAHELTNVTVRWNTTYIIYAYGMNDEGVRTTDIEWIEVKTPDRKNSDLTFNIWLDSIEFDEEKSNSIQQTYIASIDIEPSNDEEEFAARSIYDTTWDNSTLDTEEWMAQNFIYDCLSGLKGYVRLQCEVSTLHDRYLVVAGFENGTPTTEPTLFKFTTEDKPTKLEAVDSDEIVVLPYAGGIRIFGDYEYASVWTPDGKTVKALRGEKSVELAAGYYIVKVTANGKELTEKVIVR